MTMPSRLSRRRRPNPDLGLNLRRFVLPVPMLLLVVLLAVPASLAYFTSEGQQDYAWTTGSFFTLMTLSPDPAGIDVTGNEGTSFSTTLSVTSKAEVTLPIRASWGGPAVPGTNITISQDFIAPGESVTVNVGGEFVQSAESQVKIAIGQDYDWTLVPFKATSLSQPLNDVIEVVQEAKVFYTSGTAAPKFENLLVATLYAKGDDMSLAYTVTQQPQDTAPVTLVVPESTPFTVTKQGVELRINQDIAVHKLPTRVTITLTSTAAHIKGSQTISFTLAHSGDKKLVEGQGGAP